LCKRYRRVEGCPQLSDHRGIQDQDPAERLATALRRIAVGIERREAVAAATQAALDAASRAGPVERRPDAAAHPVEAVSLPAVAADLDALIGRLRTVLDSMPAADERDRES